MRLLFSKKPPVVERRHTSGAARAPIYSYYARRSQLPEPTSRELFRPVLTRAQASRAMRYSLRRFGAVIALLVLAVSLASCMTLSGDVRVLTVGPGQRMFLRDSAVYERAAQRLFSASLMNRIKLSVDTQAVGAALERQFPELASVSIKLPLIDRRPIVYLEPTVPTLLLTTTRSETFLVDGRGRALAAGQAGKNPYNLPLVADESGAAVHVGQQALPVSAVAFMRAIVFQMGHVHLSVSTFVLPAGKSELDAYLNGERYFVKYNLASSTAQQQIGTFLAVRHHLQEQGIVTSLQYIDVRVDGRAYYK